MEAPQLCAPEWEAYQLLDSGDGRKLERFGDQLLVRPEPKAWWPANDRKAWRGADAEYLDRGIWRMRTPKAVRSWLLHYNGLKLEARLTDMSKHVGVFPEQAPHWEWIRERLEGQTGQRVLNLFGYTGVASLVAAVAGGEVTHVDASKPAIAWGRENQAASGLDAKPVRWLLDDAFKFVQREIRRERKYDLILLDPPSFGRGPKGEVWKVENQMVDLLTNLRQLLPPEKGALVMTIYNLEASSLMLANLVRSLLPGGRMTFGELVLPEAGRLNQLPLSLYARWWKGGD